MNQAPQRPRLIATDLDGTLLCQGGTVSARTAAALAAAEEAGIQVVFVTGRPPRWMQWLGQHIGGHGVAICSNGGVVFDVRRELVLESFPLRAEVTGEVVELLRGRLPGTAFAFEFPGGFAREPQYQVPMWGSEGDHPIATAEELLADGRVAGCYKLLAKHPELDPDTFLEQGRAAVGALAEITRSSPIPLLEISAPGVTKASTLARWCAEHGIDRSQVVAFGDMPNDLEMLAWAGTGYAVANAHPHVLAAVANRTVSNQEDGVARVIEQLLAS
ncbi:Cof subfamily protein (haloacid dehalogenase superfamily) [Kitasatospora sp. MAP12-15]|uniref:HAD family hydrolase n=1 Tax=unclassified Kitasatospora TaxID=2633591 RepID=UPI0024758D14|nr:Cof-type HAD-IIB family hydrolase [Kitasatospora sp. MAP12-44]MDH6112054.1 Cof subfamily protein (haloacid dehalogenase superfamily) [Kitasatospora sp. MAP12-44]